MAKEPFSLKDVTTLKEGILAEEAGIKPLSRFGVDFTLRPSTVFGALPGIGDLAILGQAIGKTQLESSATNLLNSTSPNQLDTGLGATMKRAGTGKSATSAVIDEIRQFKDRDPYSTTENISRDDIQRYLMSKRPDLDLAPIQRPRFTKDELDSKSNDFYKAQQQYYTQPFSSGRTAQNITGTDFRKDIDPTVKSQIQEELGMAGFQDVQGALRGGYYDNELKSVSDFAEDKITQSNITNLVDERTGKSLYDPAFARAVTLENQREAGSDTSADSTFLCTAFFEMKDLPRNIYKYDKLYGEQVNRRIYDGYAIWGKPMAERVKNKKLAYKIMKPIVCAWAEQMAFDLSNGKVGKNRLSIKIGKVIGEAICYSIGLFINLKGDINGRNRSRQHGEERRVVRGENGLPKRRGRPRINRRAIS